MSRSCMVSPDTSWLLTISCCYYWGRSGYVLCNNQRGTRPSRPSQLPTPNPRLSTTALLARRERTQLWSLCSVCYPNGPFCFRPISRPRAGTYDVVYFAKWWARKPAVGNVFQLGPWRKSTDDAGKEEARYFLKASTWYGIVSEYWFENLHKWRLSMIVHILYHYSTGKIWKILGRNEINHMYTCHLATISARVEICPMGYMDKKTKNSPVVYINSRSSGQWIDLVESLFQKRIQGCLPDKHQSNFINQFVRMYVTISNPNFNTK
jgi:hypothetical protein